MENNQVMAKETEGTMTQAEPKMNLLQRIWYNPTARKVAKWVGRISGGAILLGAGFIAGKNSVAIPASGTVDDNDDEEDAE